MLKNFGKEWVLQGVFDDLAEMNINKENWERIGHKTMIKGTNVLYVTRFKQ